MIEAGSLTKVYGRVPALDSVSFSIAGGEIIGIIGHNGAGKTTLLKILAGLTHPTSGSLAIQGIDVVRDPASVKGMTGYLPEESRLYETMRADQYLTFFGEIYGLDRATIRERQMALCAALALSPDGKRLGEFSKGMKRKVAIARSLIHDPGLLIYDEPTSGLDPMTSRFIIQYLRQLREAGKTVVLSAHNLYQVEAICDRVMILRRGRIEAMGSMPDLRRQYGSICYQIYFSSEKPGRIEGIPPVIPDGGQYLVTAGSIGEMNSISARIAESGGTVERIESHFPSLEEMLALIGQ